MGFFDIPDKVGKSSQERGPVENTVQAKWAMGLLKAMELCTTSDRGQQLFNRYIHVKKYLTDRWQVEATDGDIALRVMLEQEHIDAMSSATGTPWGIDDEGMWLKGTGWEATDVPYPNMDRRDIYPACMSQVPMLLLVMPCRNPDMEFEGMNEVPEEVTR